MKIQTFTISYLNQLDNKINLIINKLDDNLIKLNNTINLLEVDTINGFNLSNSFTRGDFPLERDLEY